MIMNRKYLSWFSLGNILMLFQIIFGALLLIVLLSSVMLPIYADEIAWKLVKTNVWLSDFSIKTLLPQCSVNPEVVPVLLIPGAILYSFIYSSNDPVILRLVGIFIVFTCWFVLFSITTKVINDKYKSKTTYITLLAICSLGVMPFIYVLFRPEAIMLFSILVLIWGSLNVDRLIRGSRLTIALAVTLFFILSSLMFYAHAKALFFTPLLIFLIIYCYGRLGKVGSYLLAGGVLGIAFQAYVVSKGMSVCKESAYVTSLLKGHMLSLPTDFFDLISKLVSNIRPSLDNLVSHIGFDSSYQSNWLPKDPSITVLQSSIGQASEGIISLLSFGLVFLFAIRLGHALFSKKITKNDIVGGLVLVGVLAQLAFYNSAAMSFYNLGLIVPLELLALIFLCAPFINKVSVNTLRLICMPIILFGIVNLLVLINNVAYPLVNLNFSDKRIEISESQIISAKTILTKSQLGSLKSLAGKCQLPINNANRLIVDGVSFRIFNQIKDPVLVFYAEGGWIGREIDPVFGQFFKQYGSDGVMVACRFIPKQMRDRVVKQDGMCCISKNNLY